jgi:hypothetical protein
MAHSVIITTPRLTLDELGKQYGLSKAEQESLIRLVREKGSGRRTVGAPRVRRTVSSRPAKTGSQENTGPARKKNTLVRANA